MNHRSLAMLLGCCAMLAAGTASAAIIGARAMPRQASLVATGDNQVSVSWQVSTTPDHSSGVSSTTAAIVDPASGAVLQAVRTTLGANGAGPFALRELLGLDAATVRSWTDQGIRRVVLERSFVDPATGSSSSAAMVLALSRSPLYAPREGAPADLSIVSLRLELDTGNNSAITTIGESLRASLTVQYAGSGMLQGRWQIAEPESSESAPLFRTLALVNSNLQANQQSTLRSPALPTAHDGKYLVRFCVTSREQRDDAGLTGDALCPDADLTVMATYYVQGEAGHGANLIETISPDRRAVSEDSPFSWRPLAGAVVYQLQVFEPAQSAAGPNDVDRAEPRFVTGMLLGATTSTTPLSELARSKLQAGQRYLWRVTALDEAGRMIGSSVEASFVYRPGG